jgi:epoxide hydrolase-like predicted phosphatase
LLIAVNVNAMEDDWRFDHYEKTIEGGIKIPEQLKENGYRIAILPNDSKESAQQRRKNYGFDDLFDEVIISSHYGYIKPDPEIYRIALKKLNIEPEQSVFIDDRKENIETSKRLGMHSILFRNVDQVIQNLKNMGIEL